MIRIKKIKKNKSISVGAGLVALDVILNGNPLTPAKLCAGGSCGNVLSILGFLGWKSYPIARLSNNNASDKLFDDFSNFDICTDLISKSEDGTTPVIIHRILKDKNGNPKHRFEFRIPETSVWLPSYKPVLASAVERIITDQPFSNVYYFDRISRSTIDLAKYYKSVGALIVFEPSSIKRDKQFEECLELVDIIKFSNDRISNYSEIFPNPICKLEIQTLGNEGLQYRLRSDINEDWKKLTPFIFNDVIDTAGAGDWCTAGIINELGYDGVKSFNDAAENTIENALKIGQVLGGLNCNYDGARGIMYNMNIKSLINVAEAILNKKDVPNIEPTNIEILTIKNFNFETIF